MILLLVLSVSCGEDVELPNQILQGKINDMDWTFEVGKANSNLANQEYFVSLFNRTGFREEEGCLLQGGTGRFITLNVPFNVGNNAQLDAIRTNLRFSLDGNTVLTADQGTVEISFVNTTEIRGFITAASSDENEVQGFFSVLICD